MAAPADYDQSVFINCPFDAGYRDIFRAIVFVTTAADLIPRCALEAGDSSEVRLDKLNRIIAECRFGIHDLSRTQLDANVKLPRFNMPFELGLFMGCKRFGTAHQRRKSCLILESRKYDFQKCLSDIAGSDIQAHDDDPFTVVRLLRDWFRTEGKLSALPGGNALVKKYVQYLNELPDIAARLGQSADQLTFADEYWGIQTWLAESGEPNVTSVVGRPGGSS